MRYRLDLAYHGRDFHGWQRQPGLRTVQGELESWLGRLLGSESAVAVTGAGRTDTGVHAAGMVAHFDSDITLAPEELLMRLNRALPPDLVVASLVPADSEFHARYSATGRVYSYRVATKPTPFDRDRHWLVCAHLDSASLGDAASALLGKHDFSGFCRAASRKGTNHCQVTESVWQVEGDVLVYRIHADRFLHEMVRLLVGTMVDIGRGRFGVGRISEILASRDVRLCGEAAPAHALTLEMVMYQPRHESW
jgi:tRNA pseudouridine38-40 synthase